MFHIFFIYTIIMFYIYFISVSWCRLHHIVCIGCNLCAADNIWKHREKFNVSLQTVFNFVTIFYNHFQQNNEVLEFIKFIVMPTPFFKNWSFCFIKMISYRETNPSRDKFWYGKICFIFFNRMSIYKHHIVY